MTRLISYIDSFRWHNPHVDRGESISFLNAALVKATELKNHIYKTPHLDNLNLSWGNFLEFFYSYGFDEAQRRQVFPWMTQTQHTTLVYLLNYFKNTTPLNATDLNSLMAEFPGQNCGNIGFEHNPQPIKYVFCEASLTEIHRNFVSTFSYDLRCQNQAYFKQFFIPGLTQQLNQINQLIRRGQFPAIIERLDDGGIKGEQVHVHFGGQNPCALNIDGSWKHPNPRFIMPMDVRRLLSQWGFLLPDNLYQ